MKRNPIKKVLILVSILAIPGFLFFYLLPHFAKNRYKSLPIFGDKVVASTFHSVKGKKIPDTIYHQIPDFKLINQSNDTISWKSYKDKILVVNLFDAGSGDRPTNKYIRGLSSSYENKPLVRFASLSVNAIDQISLRNFSDQFNVLSAKLDLLAGDTVQVYPLIRKGLLLDVVATGTPQKPSFIYSNKILLIDHLHRIRGIYEGDNQQATERLEDEIKVLIAEYLRTLKDGR
ncbi:SCO family protein [Pedobacter sandarakinus]|uniref:SCO family protein n=1 Tax=Pedobacter sandarakinus TaxID=353156 RepID=UPI002246E35B|nr:SCO family protein [Pedobacter sandarakinus]MCX2573278.1 SCO family protein [Pedobacter sandarakinus]